MALSNSTGLASDAGGEAADAWFWLSLPASGRESRLGGSGAVAAAAVVVEEDDGAEEAVVAAAVEEDGASDGATVASALCVEPASAWPAALMLPDGVAAVGLDMAFPCWVAWTEKEEGQNKERNIEKCMEFSRLPTEGLLNKSTYRHP